jgi:hypothetical protein
MTVKKLAICPYCGESLSKRPKSIDHIIPKQIGGASSFKIISCQNCNTEIGKIEQRAMSTMTISNLSAEMGESGFNIKTRRKRDFIPLQKSIGLAGRSPVKFYYNSKTHKKELHFLSPPNKELMALMNEKGTFYMLSPDLEAEDSEKDEVSLVSLASKIILGTCVWLWGDDFSNTKHASNLRNMMRDVKVEKILKMDSSEKHLELSDDPGKDALDNQPHHSILIGKLNENIVVGLINLFGSFESMSVIGSYDDKFRNWIGDSGVVVISKTTTNEVLKMTWEKYESFKSKTKKLNRIGNSSN